MAVQDKYADEMLKDEQLDGVAGGSWFIGQEEGEAAGLYLLKSDGSPGEWGNLWNTGDYYFNGHKLNGKEATACVNFYKAYGRRPESYDALIKSRFNSFSM